MFKILKEKSVIIVDIKFVLVKIIKEIFKYKWIIIKTLAFVLRFRKSDEDKDKSLEPEKMLI